MGKFLGYVEIGGLGMGDVFMVWEGVWRIGIFFFLIFMGVL